jgi:hypothetical protein
VTVDEEIVEYLEHFGVKGMHWGVRNSRSNVSLTPKERTAAEKKKFIKRAAIGTGIAAVAVGAIIATSMLKGNGKTTIRELKPLNSDKAARLIFRNADKKVDAIKKAASRGDITALQSKRMRDLHTKQWISAVNRLSNQHGGLRPGFRT